MKSFMMSIFAALLVVAVSGCCTGSGYPKAKESGKVCKKSCPKAKESGKVCKKSCPKAEKGKKNCPNAKKCTRPCAKAAKCPFVGKWEIFVSKNGQLAKLPVDHSPKLELCKKGVLRFHFVKDGKQAVVEGKWKIAGKKLVISDAAGKNNQYYTLKDDGSAEFVVGKNDRLPENTKVVIRKIK